MSRHFDANQYETSFRPFRLCNWESAKWYPHERPRARRGHTKIIADDRGHLLPGVPRLAPWGHFKSTWQLPKRITRKLAKELVSARLGRKEKSSWEKRSSHHPLIEQQQQEGTVVSSTTPPLPPPTKKERRRSGEKKYIPIVEEKQEAAEEEIERSDFVKDEHDYTNPVGHDRTPAILPTAEKCREDIQSYNQTCKINPEKKNLLEKLVSGDEEKGGEEKLDRDSMRSDEARSVGSKDSGRGDSLRSLGKGSPEKEGSAKSGSSSSSRKSKKLEADFISAQFAKDLKTNNLKHRPLPDAVDDKFFRALQMQGVKHPGAELEHITTARAVGHKKYVSPGPTQCSKLKVYRPKTAAPPPIKKGEEEDRPRTSRNKDLTEIDLAICWDLIPPRPEDEPRRPKHIDGSNGSIAPGIFTIVKHSDQESPPATSPKDSKSKKNGKNKPKTAWPDINEKSKPVNPSAVMDIINNNVEGPTSKVTEHDPYKKSRNENSKGHLVPINGSKENNNPNIPTPPGSSKNSRTGGSNKDLPEGTLNSSVDSDKLRKQSPRARSSPNLSVLDDERHNKDKLFHTRSCKACETRTVDDSKLPKAEYKMAFKAGVPHSKKTNSNSGSQDSSSKALQVPKPKTPFARKSYSISTLAPPFSLWPGTTGMDYPEHWRLSSVYQQSYKPIQLRKNPMIKGIFR